MRSRSRFRMLLLASSSAISVYFLMQYSWLGPGLVN